MNELLRDLIKISLVVIFLPFVVWVCGYMFFRGGISGILDLFKNNKIDNYEKRKEE